MFPQDFSNLFDDEKTNINKIINKESELKTCNTVVIAKLYKNEEEYKQKY